MCLKCLLGFFRTEFYSLKRHSIEAERHANRPPIHQGKSKNGSASLFTSQHECTVYSHSSKGCKNMYYTIKKKVQNLKRRKSQRKVVSDLLYLPPSVALKERGSLFPPKAAEIVPLGSGTCGKSPRGQWRSTVSDE